MPRPVGAPPPNENGLLAGGVSGQSVVVAHLPSKERARVRIPPGPPRPDPAASFVDFHNHGHCHEALANVTSAGVYNGRREAALARRKELERRTIEEGERFKRCSVNREASWRSPRGSCPGRAWYGRGGDCRRTAREGPLRRQRLRPSASYGRPPRGRSPSHG